MNLLRPFLPPLIPVLMKALVYSDMDLAMMSGQDDTDDYVPDRAEDLRPIFAHSKAGAASRAGNYEGGDGDDAGSEADEDDDEDATDWNLRKCAAASLDSLAEAFQAEILPIVLPELNTKLADAHDWKARESAILALGAIAEGCYDGLQPHLPGLVPFLLQLLQDPMVLTAVCCVVGWSFVRFAFSFFVPTLSRSRLV